MPSEQRRNEVAHGENVEAARKRDAGDSVKHGRIPCDLGSVDTEMRRDGPVEALLRENVLWICRLGRCRRRPA